MDKQEVIKHIEEIGQRLTILQLSMELLATHTDVIDVLTPEELKSSTMSSEELSILCYEKLDKVKQKLKEVM